MMDEREPSRREVAGGVGRLLGGGVLLAAGAASLRFAAWQPPQREAVVFAAEGDGVRLERGVWLVRQGREIWALDGRCTHLGCAVGLEAGGDGFVCPCHGSRYDLAGDVLHGPADEPLARLQVERVGEEIHVHWP